MLKKPIPLESSNQPIQASFIIGAFVLMGIICVSSGPDQEKQQHATEEFKRAHNLKHAAFSAEGFMAQTMQGEYQIHKFGKRPEVCISNTSYEAARKNCNRCVDRPIFSGIAPCETIVHDEGKKTWLRFYPSP